MKFENATSDADDILISDQASSNKVGIQAGNMDWIIQILSTNLYQYPIASFLRETVSNAWDSHVEAGHSEPVVVEIKKEEQQWYCQITDFGVGISPERFDDIYRNIGSSTKRDSNKQIGGFGIGRFTALAVAESATITSIHGGKKTIYIMYKENLSIKIDALPTMDTTERNGVSVKVDIESGEVGSYFEAVKSQLTFFDNVHVESETSYSDEIETFRETKLKYYPDSNFTLCDRSVTEPDAAYILLGKVTYPLPSDIVKPDIMANLTIGINFDIGELGVVPNRENIIVNSSSKAVIQKRLTEVASALAEHCKALCLDIVLDTPSDLLDILNRKMGHNGEMLHLFGEYNTVEAKEQDYTYIYEGESYTIKELRSMNTVLKPDLDNDPIKNLIRYRMLNGKICYSANPIMFGNFYKFMLDHRKDEQLYVSDIPNLKTIAKSYIRAEEKSHGKLIYNAPVFFKYLNEFRDTTHVIYEGKMSKLLKSIKSQAFTSKVFNNLTHVDDDNVPQEYIDDYKEKKRVAKLGKTRNVIHGSITTHEVVQGSYEMIYSAVTKTAEETLKAYSTQLVVYSNHSDEKERKDLSRFAGAVIAFNSGLAREPVAKFIGLSAKNCKLFEEDYDNVVNSKIFMKAPYKETRDLATYFAVEEMYIKHFGPNYYTAPFSSNTNLELLFPDAYKIMSYLSDLSGRRELNLLKARERVVEDMISMCASKKAFSPEMELFEKALPQLLAFHKVYGKMTTSHYTPQGKGFAALLYQNIIRRKFFRPEGRAVLALQRKHKDANFFHDELKILKDDYNNIHKR